MRCRELLLLNRLSRNRKKWNYGCRRDFDLLGVPLVKCRCISATVLELTNTILHQGQGELISLALSRIVRIAALQSFDGEQQKIVLVSESLVTQRNNSGSVAIRGAVGAFLGFVLKTTDFKT